MLYDAMQVGAMQQEGFPFRFLASRRVLLSVHSIYSTLPPPWKRMKGDSLIPKTALELELQFESIATLHKTENTSYIGSVGAQLS